jgi:hypothetical protein
MNNNQRDMQENQSEQMLRKASTVKVPNAKPMGELKRSMPVYKKTKRYDAND